MMHSLEEIFGDFGRSSATTLSKRKSQEKRDNDVEDQLFVNKKHSQKKVESEGSWRKKNLFLFLCFQFAYYYYFLDLVSYIFRLGFYSFKQLLILALFYWL